MKKLKKNIFWVLVLLFNLLIISSNQVLAANPVSGDYSYKILEDGTAEIRDYTGTATKVKVPEKIDGYTVTAMYGTFYGNKTIKSVEVPDTVNTIGKSTFYDCSSLTKVTLPKNLKSLGDFAFAWCVNLTKIELPDNITTIGEQAFMHCEKLVSIELPKSLISLGRKPFTYAYKLSSINISTDNKYFLSDEGVLLTKDKSQLICYPPMKSDVEYVVPSGVLEINELAFFYCSNLNKVTVSKGVESIGDCAFSDCSSLKELYLPDSVWEIGIFAFSNCEALKDVYYDGYEAGWKSIELDSTGNACLLNANIHCTKVAITYTEAPAFTLPPKASERPIVIPETDYEKGDIDGNRCIDAQDALLVLKHAAKITELDESTVNSADVDKNGIVDAKDALYILQYAAKIIVRFVFTPEENISIIKDYIKENGILDDNGCYVISENYTVEEDAPYTEKLDSFTYNEKEDTLIYKYDVTYSDEFCKYSYSNIVELGEEKSTVKFVCSEDSEEKELEFDLEKTIENSNIKITDDFNKKIKSNKYVANLKGDPTYSETEQFEEDNNVFINAGMHMALLSMEDYLKNTVVVNLKDLGFSDYSYNGEQLFNVVAILYGIDVNIMDSIENVIDVIKEKGRYDGDEIYIEMTEWGWGNFCGDTRLVYNIVENILYFTGDFEADRSKNLVSVYLQPFSDRYSYVCAILYAPDGKEVLYKADARIKSKEIKSDATYELTCIYPEDSELTSEAKGILDNSITTLADIMSHVIMTEYDFNSVNSIKQLGIINM